MNTLVLTIHDIVENERRQEHVMFTFNDLAISHFLDEIMDKLNMNLEDNALAIYTLEEFKNAEEENKVDGTPSKFDVKHEHVVQFQPKVFFKIQDFLIAVTKDRIFMRSCKNMPFWG